LRRGPRAGGGARASSRTRERGGGDRGRAGRRRAGARRPGGRRPLARRSDRRGHRRAQSRPRRRRRRCRRGRRTDPRACPRRGPPSCPLRARQPRRDRRGRARLRGRFDRRRALGSRAAVIRTTVIGSYPLPGWLELAAQHLDELGPDDVSELQEDAVIAAVHDQVAAGLDVITDGEQTRLDFNLSFYGYLEGIALEAAPRRRFGPPAHDQRGRHAITGELRAPRGLGAVAEFERLRRLAPNGPTLKASVPGPYTLSGRLIPGGAYADRWAVTEA